MSFSLVQAGRWLLDSGIQAPSGGFARFYDAEKRKNRAVSTEITGYAASALVYLFRLTGDESYLAGARKTACFLTQAWDARLRTFPFEHPSPSTESDHLSYFFDCGIIIRGLLAVWRETQDEQLLEIAVAAGRGMIADFHSGADYHPVLALPEKDPLHRTDRWSRAPGCYQLKSAMAWWDLAEITGESALRDSYLEMLNSALASQADFLPGASSAHQIMDRLHPYCYFLEGLLPVLDRIEVRNVYREGMCAIHKHLDAIKQTFVRSDVYAQLLRARIYGASVTPVDAAAAAEEAAALAPFQAAGQDVRVHGGFFFGRRDGGMSSHVSPVSTVFALQSLEMWRQHQADAKAPAEGKPPCRLMLI